MIVRLIVVALLLLYTHMALADDDNATPADSRMAPTNSIHLKNSAGAKQDEPVAPAVLTVCGTWNALQAISTLIGQYENGRQSRNIHFVPADSDQIMELLRRHQCDIGIPFDSFVPKANDNRGDQYESFSLGRFVIAVAVNATSPLRTMSIDDVQKAFAMNLMTGPGAWKDISGSGSTMSIELYRPDKFGPEGWFFQKRILFGGPFADEFSRESIAQHQKKSDAEIIGAIAKQANSIGFFRCPFDKIKEKRIRILGVAKDKDRTPVFPSPASLADGIGNYPLADTLTIYLHPDAPAEAKEFCKFAAGPKGRPIVKQCGFWPEHELKEIRAKQHLLAVKRGKGDLIAVWDLTGSGRLLKDLGQEFVKVKAAVQLGVEGDDDAEGRLMVLTPEEAEQELRVKGSDLLLAVGTPTKSEEQRMEGKEKKAALTPTLAKRENGKAEDKGQPSPESLAPRLIVLGRMAVGVVVHPKNVLDALPLDELQGIFGGDVTQWPGANGAAGTMHVCGLRYTDPMTQLLKERLGDKELKYNVQSDTAKVVLEVAKDPFAIGFVDLSQLSPDEKSVKLLGVYLPGQPKQVATKESSPHPGPLPEGEGTSGKNPNPKSAATRLTSLAAYHLPEDYPLMRTFTLYVSPNASETAKDFSQFVASDRCAETLLKHNLLPPLHVDREKAAPEKPPEKSQKPTNLGNRR